MKHADIKAMMAEIAPVIREFTEAAVQPVMARLDAMEKQLADLPDIAGMVSEAVDAAVKAIPAPQAGKDGEKGEKGDTGPGIDDIDVDLIEDGATAVFTFSIGDTDHSFEVPLPAGPRGPSGDKGDKGDPGKDGRDGLDVKDMFRAEGGRLVAVMSDGATRDLGEYVGKDGKDGAPGRDGADGVGFDDMDLVETDDGLSLRFVKGDLVKEFPLPVPVDRGVWKPGTYRKGSFVTWAGSGWIAQEDTDEKPDTGKGWRLAIKKGRDGKDKP